MWKMLLVTPFLFADTAFSSVRGETLAATVRDDFDELSENPAQVSMDGQSHLRLGKGSTGSGAQLIGVGAGLALGLQVGYAPEESVSSVTGLATSQTSPGYSASSGVLQEAARQLSSKGVPVQLTVGRAFGNTKVGLAMSREVIDDSGRSTVLADLDGDNDKEETPMLSPRYGSWGTRLGTVYEGRHEFYLGYSESVWSVRTTLTRADLVNFNSADDLLTVMDDGVSEQKHLVINAGMRTIVDKYRPFLTYRRDQRNLRLWDQSADKTSGTSSDFGEYLMSDAAALGTEYEHALHENFKIHNRAEFDYGRLQEFGSKTATTITDLSLATGHGFEYKPTSWMSLRCGYRMTLISYRTTEVKAYQSVGRTGASRQTNEKQLVMMRSTGAPLVGFGFSYGVIEVDTALGRTDSESFGFTDDLFSRIELTARF